MGDIFSRILIFVTNMEASKSQHMHNSEAPDGVFGRWGLGVKMAGDGRIGQTKCGRWEKINAREQKNVRNSQLHEGAGRLCEIKVGDWDIQTSRRGHQFWRDQRFFRNYMGHTLH